MHLLSSLLHLVSVLLFLVLCYFPFFLLLLRTCSYQSIVKRVLVLSGFESENHHPHPYEAVGGFVKRQVPGPQYPLWIPGTSREMVAHVHVLVPHSHYSLPVVCSVQGQGKREKNPPSLLFFFSSTVTHQPPLLPRSPPPPSLALWHLSFIRPSNPSLGRFLPPSSPPKKTLLHLFPPPLPPYFVPSHASHLLFFYFNQKGLLFFSHPHPASTCTSTSTHTYTTVHTHMRTHAHIHIHRITSNPLSHTLALCIVH